jgi:hypothetical protein
MTDKEFDERVTKIGADKVAAWREKCAHDSMYWYLSPHDERGWMCSDCFFRPGEEPGYSPEHDRDHIETKCLCILHDLTDEDSLSVSNGSHGEGLARSAANVCRDKRRFDQESIVTILANLCAGDGKFWREQHEGILSGKDPRRRCRCGKIARCWSGGPNGGTHYCSFGHRPDAEIE